MNFVTTLFKWLFGLLMGVGLFIGITLIAAQSDKDAIPQSVDDLETVHVTITEQKPAIDNMATLKTQEHPDGSLMMTVKSGYDANATPISLKPDDQIDVSIRKLDVDNLDGPTAVIVWGARTAGGRTLLDANKMIDEMHGPVMKSLHNFAYALIVLPAVYFFGLIFSLFKKKPRV